MCLFFSLFPSFYLLSIFLFGFISVTVTISPSVSRLSRSAHSRDRTGSRRQFPLDAFVIGRYLAVATGVAVDQHHCIASQDVCSEKDIPISYGASVLKNRFSAFVRRERYYFGLWSREHTLRRRRRKNEKKKKCGLSITLIL